MRRGKKLHRLIAAAAAILAVGGALVGCSSSNDKEITIGWLPWDEDVAATHLWKHLLEEKGYTVKLVQADAGPLFAGLAKGGSNDPDLFLDGWLPDTHGKYWDQYGDKLEDVSTWYDNASLQLAVPNFVSDVNSLADLAGKADKFDKQVVGIEPGAGEMTTVKEKVMPAYNLTNDYKLTESSTPAMLTTLQKSIDSQKPVVVTLWKPHWAYTKFPIKPLADPQGAFGQAEKIHVLANKKWAGDNSEVTGWLKNFKMTDEQLGTLENEIQNAGSGNEDKAIDAWLQANPDFAAKMTG
ncbi:glycine betaine ABC transporter substrate-binding protein [Nocardia sp. BMG51109]|uniref:glycine betaine ABC transporter substrate-binding protein n=1 Tax=Nocardia sp. BMG51109 TaxID=1056816 RepID=UPI0004646883|nr:glycine betaine ABC transporter substrate-binding protein [Nocardia sp. BMG51109]